ncbi:NAD-dependent DNA ligase LigA [soil metagenome]
MYTPAQEKEYLDLSRRMLSTPQPQTLEEADKIVKDLRDAIRYHDWRYYVQAKGVISDYEYDHLFKLLKNIEAEYPELLMPDSPTQRVALGLTEEFVAVEHNLPMLSLDNSYNEADIAEFDTRLRKLVGTEGIEYCVEPKFDGSSIALVYENDLLVRAATRGDGVMGEDITQNAKALKSIPLRAEFSKYGILKAEVRGEVIIRNEVFSEMNEKRREQGLKTFQNSRNTAAGALRLKDSAEVARRGLEAIIYQIGYAVDKYGKNVLGNGIESHYESIQTLYKLGFNAPVKELGKYTTVAQTVAHCADWEEKRNTYPIEIDGMVIKLDNYKKQQQTGSTSHHPRWAIAFKFKARQAHSILERVEFQVGRTGAVTPVAKITPVPLAGVTIGSISLHNEDFILEKDIMLGDTVLVERAGDVIPYIAGVITTARTGNEQPIIFPRECPCCASTLVKPEGEAIWRCVNLECPVQQEERIIHFVSKGAMDIEGLGKDIVKRFMAEGIINQLEDIYQLDYDRILALEGWKEKSVANLKHGIEDSKGRPLWRLITALGIRHIGNTTAKVLAKQVKSALDYTAWDQEKLTQLEDVGPKVAESVHEFFHTEANLDLLRKLQELGVNIETKQEEVLPANNKLDGKSFLFTGTLTKFTREEAQALVEQNGGKLISGVSKNLDYLVAGPGAGSKLTKAQSIPTIQVIDEDGFLILIA